MTRRPEAPFGERTEREIRDWVRDRDAGPAPERLRMRLARVAEARPAPRWGIRSLLRPAYAVAGAVAVATLIVVAMVVRSVPGPAAPGSSATPSGPAATATSIDLGAMPNGPWPRTGPVLAVPVDGILLPAVAAVALLAGLAMVILLGFVTVREARRSDSPRNWPWLGLWATSSRRTRIARVAAVLLASILVATGCGLLQFAQGTPLTYGSSLGAGLSLLGYRSGTGGGIGESYYPFVPGGELDLIIDLSNQGDMPLTVTSFDQTRFLAEQSAGAYISSVELRLPPGASSSCGSGQDSRGLCTQPFHPFELPPWRGGVSAQGGAYAASVLIFIVHMKDCRGVAPGSTPDPSSSSRQNYLPATPYVTFGELPFRYSYLGIERETDVRMNESVGLVFGSNEVAC